MTDTSVLDQEKEAGFGDYVALLKPRVMSLVVFTALVGLLVAPVDVHPLVGFASILFIAIGAGASGALNMWYDADIDRIMSRTRGRPVPSGKVSGGRGAGHRRRAVGHGRGHAGAGREYLRRRACWPSRSSSTPSSTRCG